MQDLNVARLRRLDCCALSDALDRLGLEGVVTGLRRRSGSGRIAGRAVTMRLGAGQPPVGPARHLGTAAIEAADADCVIVVEQRSGIDAASWGGLLSLGASLRGIAGVVVDGPARDIDEACSCGFPVFSRSVTARTARGRIVELGTHVPVTLGAVAISPGDYVAADRSAVVCIRATDLNRVLAAAEEIMAREAAMAAALRAGRAISAVMGGEYEHMLQPGRKPPAGVQG